MNLLRVTQQVEVIQFLQFGLAVWPHLTKKAALFSRFNGVPSIMIHCLRFNIFSVLSDDLLCCSSGCC